jgi:hypothetical protein
MAYMFLPMSLKVVPESAWEAVFATLAAATGAWVVVTWTTTEQ